MLKVKVRSCVFWMEKQDEPAALRAIKALNENEIQGFAGQGYKYVEDFSKCAALEDALLAWRWKPKRHVETGEIFSLEFLGQFLGYDVTMFNAIARFVEDDSYIEMQDESGNVWRWVFVGDKCVTKHPKLVWEERTK